MDKRGYGLSMAQLTLLGGHLKTSSIAIATHTWLVILNLSPSRYHLTDNMIMHTATCLLVLVLCRVHRWPTRCGVLLTNLCNGTPTHPSVYVDLIIQNLGRGRDFVSRVTA